MLTVHRTGKRHLAGLKQFYGKNQQLKNEVEKRRHQDYVKAEEEGRKVIIESFLTDFVILLVS
ncbi:SCNM1 protein, partial [Polypterus senegalus]